MEPELPQLPKGLETWWIVCNVTYVKLSWLNWWLAMSELPTSIALSGDMHRYGCRAVGEFEKLEKIGEGTYGAVFRARDKLTSEIVALKQVKVIPSNGFPLTSIREIGILKTLIHPHIVLLKDIAVGNRPDSIFLVFEFCDHDFASLMERMNRKWSESEIKCLMLQLLTALQFMHSKFIIHR
jgi:serine/threonine protein kinase